MFNNPYNVNPNAALDFSESYFDAVVDGIRNKALLAELLKSSKDDVEGNVDFLWGFLPINPGFKIGCNEEQAKNVIRYLINNA